MKKKKLYQIYKILFMKNIATQKKNLDDILEKNYKSKYYYINLEIYNYYIIFLIDSKDI